jgi:RES domain-containing protein
MLIYRLGSGRCPPNDGLGASLYGGRWNHKGTPVIYAAASRALCALEVLANANELAGDYVATPIELPDDLAVVTLSIDGLPSDWDAAQATTGTADIGTEWAARLETVVLVVPSAIIAREQNYILNPRHPDFSRVRFLTSEPFQFDDRLRRAWLLRR